MYNINYASHINFVTCKRIVSIFFAKRYIFSFFKCLYTLFCNMIHFQKVTHESDRTCITNRLHQLESAR